MILKPLIILISGPPGSGKDTIGGSLAESLEELPGVAARLDKFAGPLMVCASACGFSMIEDEKEKPNEDLGVSRRQFQIWLSEEAMKLRFGKSVFGRMAGATLKRAPYPASARPVAVFTDCGFVEEAEGLAESLDFECSIVRIHLHRYGKTYVGDSRSDWEAPPMLLDERYDVENPEGRWEVCASTVFDIVQDHLEKML